MMRIFYVIKWILRSLLILLLLDLVVKSAVVAPNQKGNQDGTKLSEQRFLPETSTALNVEEANHAPKLNQIFLKRVKRGEGSRGLPKCVVLQNLNCGSKPKVKCNCGSSAELYFPGCMAESCKIDLREANWKEECQSIVRSHCRKIKETLQGKVCKIKSSRCKDFCSCKKK